MDSIDFPNLANFGITLDQSAFNFQDTIMAAGPLEESQLTDDFVVNMVNGMENVDLSTIDYDQLKLVPVEMYTNLVPLENQYEMTTVTPKNAAPENLMLSAPSPSYFEISENSLFSPSSTSPASPASSVGSESPRSILSAASPCTTEESITLVVSPAEVFGEQQQQAPLKKKRGRKPKSEYGPLSRQKRQRKVKVYEIDQPYEDKEQERKRLNAVNAKRHRDLQKQAKDILEQQLKDVIAERDNLKKEVESLRVKESDLTSQLEMFKNHLKNQHQSVVMLLQSTPGF